MNQEHEVRLVQRTRTVEEVEEYKREKRCRLWDEYFEINRQLDEVEPLTKEWLLLNRELEVIKQRLGL